MRILEEIAVFVALSAKHFGGELRGHFDSRDGTVFRHEANFVDLDAGFPGERRLQLLGQRARLGISAGKSAHKSRKMSLCGIWCEVNAGDPRTDQQLRETFFRRGSPEWHAVEQ